MSAKHLYRRPDGLYEKKLVINGKRVVFRARSEAEIYRKIAAYSADVTEGRLFTTVSDEWWEEHQKKIRYGSIHVYKSAKERADEYFKTDRVGEIEPADINAFLLYLSAHGYSAKTVSNNLTVVRQIFLYAMMNREIRSIPTGGIVIPSGLSRSSRNLAPAGMVDIVKKTSPDDFLLPALILYTGTRCGEALALRTTDIDFDKKEITINKAIVFHSNHPVVSEPKTKNAYRVVPLISPLAEILKQRKIPEGAYLIGGKETPLTRSQLYDGWEKYCRKNGLARVNEARTKKEGRTFWVCDLDRHTLRHEYATILYDAGIDARMAQELLGHSDISTTLEIYTHIRQSKLTDAAMLLNNFLDQQKAQ